MVLQLILYFGTDLQLENNFPVPEAVYYCKELLPKMAIQLLWCSCIWHNFWEGFLFFGEFLNSIVISYIDHLMYCVHNPHPLNSLDTFLC